MVAGSGAGLALTPLTKNSSCLLSGSSVFLTYIVVKERGSEVSEEKFNSQTPSTGTPKTEVGKSDSLRLGSDDVRIGSK
jgi:hypothetical protein